jgi:ATP-binding cassette subfamily B protein
MDRLVDLMRGATWRDLVASRRLDLDGEAGPPSPQPSEGAPRRDIPANGRFDRLSVRGLGYRYPSSGGGIEDIDLDIARGEFVVVTGRIGSGKTTLLRTLLGLLPAATGTIVWNGSVVADPAAFMIPPHTAYTPQVPGLFSMSLRDNLLLGLDTEPGELARAITTATMDEDLAAMPNGLETVIGPRGVRLSGGQVQRSAAARMLVRVPDLYVFDDLSSALDVETEQTLWERLFAGDDGATALVVSHRRPALRRATRVVVLHEGRVVATGTVEQLLDWSQEFRRLWAGDFSAV